MGGSARGSWSTAAGASSPTPTCSATRASATVTFDDGTESPAEVLGRDESTDLAVLRAEEVPPDVRPLPLGRSAGLAVGDPAIAIGNPFGLERTATTGIVSALKRIITAPNDFEIQNVIQTDAAINQGNSGGPLLDGAGRVIGINSQIASESGGNDGVGFAVPIDTIRPVADAIIATGQPAARVARHHRPPGHPGDRRGPRRAGRPRRRRRQRRRARPGRGRGPAPRHHARRRRRPPRRRPDRRGGRARGARHGRREPGGLVAGRGRPPDADGAARRRPRRRAT